MQFRYLMVILTVAIGTSTGISPAFSEEQDPPSNFSYPGKQGENLEGIKSPVTRLKVGNGTLNVDCTFSTLYVPMTSSSRIRIPYFYFVHATFTVRGKTSKPTEGYFRVQEKAERLTCKSSDERVFSTSAFSEAADVTAKLPGRANVIVSLAGKSVEIPLKVVQLPVTEATPVSELIEELGLPDSKIRHFIKWPRTDKIDHIRYTPTARQSIIAVEHWRYKQFPGAVLAIKNGKLFRVSSNVWRVKDIKSSKRDTRKGRKSKAQPKPVLSLAEKKAKNERAAAGRLSLAKVLLKKSKTASAKKWLRELLKKFPDTEAAKEATKLLQDL